MTPMYPQGSGLVWAAVGALFAAFVTFLFGLARLRIESHARQCEALCEDIRSAAEQAVEYWLLTATANPPPLGDEAATEAHRRLLTLEASISGLMACIDHQIELLTEEFSWEARDKINGAYASTIDALSGGEFRDRTGAPDYDRARKCPQTAGKLVAIIRAGVLEASGVRFRIWRFIGAA